MRSVGCRDCVSTRRQAPDARLCEVRRYWRVETANPRDGRSTPARAVSGIRVSFWNRDNFEQLLDTIATNRRDDPELGKMRADRIDDGSAGE